MLSSEYWNKAAEFHGHTCPGLAIGFKAVEGAIAELGLDDANLPAHDEELVCVTENDACCVDAIQALLGCTYGKANLVPRLRGKMAFSFFVRDDAACDGEEPMSSARDNAPAVEDAVGSLRAVRLCLKPDLGAGMTREEHERFLLETPYDQLFDVSEPAFGLPEPARHFASERCAVCGESTAEYALRLHEGEPVCLDCYDPYDREGF